MTSQGLHEEHEGLWEAFVFFVYKAFEPWKIWQKAIPTPLLHRLKISNKTKNQESMNSRWGAQVAAYTDEDEMDSDDKDDELIDSAFLR